jgi:hypothetical protein
MSGPRPEDFGAVPLKAAVKPEDFGAVPVAAAKTAKIGAEGLPDAIKEVSGNFSGLSKAAIGAAGAVNSAAMRLKQLVGRDLTPEDIQGLKEYKSLEEASGSAIAGNVGMNILSTLNPATALYKGGAAAAAKVLPKVFAPAAGAATSGAAITAATQPTMEGETALGNMGEGAAGSVIADTATRGLARVAQPVMQSQPVQRLLKEGVVPTIGQSAGGFLNRVEQQLESVPLIGAFITNARGRAVKEMNESAIQKALPAGSSEAIKAGREGVERAGDIIDGAYDRAYGQLKGVYGGDKPFQNAIKDIPTKEGIDLPPSLQERFDKLIQDRVYARLDKGANAETVRDIHNSLGALARKYRSSGDADQRALGMAFAEAKKEFRETVSRQTTTGEFKGTLDALDQKYSALLAVEKASGYSGSKEGVFSAEALNRASKKATSMQEFTNDASDVLGRTVPDSGTAGRALLPLAGLAAAGGNEYLGGPGFVTGALAAPLLYSRPGAKYAVGALPLQKIISDALRSTAPFASQAGREAGNRY